MMSQEKLSKLRNYGYEVTPVGDQVEGSPVTYLIEGYGAKLYVAENNEEVLNSLLDPTSHAARVDAFEHPPPPPTVEELAKAAERATNEGTIRQALTDSLVPLQAIIDAQSPTNAQVVQAVKTLAANQKKLVRLLLRQLDGTT